MMRTLSLLLVLAATARAQSTWSFCDRRGGSHPETLLGLRDIDVQLSPLPEGAVIHRAIFRPGRDPGEAFRQRNASVKVTVGGEALALLAPRYRAFDMTEALRSALKEGKRRLRIDIVELPGYRPLENRLDVTLSAPSPREIPRVRDLKARHRAGQTILTWTQPRPDLPGRVTFRDWPRVRDQAGEEIRFRIYRASRPITPESIAEAELVDEVGPLTGWNPDRYGISPKRDAEVPRFVVDEGAGPVGPSTGVYAHHPPAAGRSWYAVTMAVDGVEDLGTFDAGNALAEPVEETAGPGEPVLQEVTRPESFNYVKGPELHWFVRWEAPPRANLPSQPIDYLVALPPGVKEPAPVGLHLHCWGGSLQGGYGWWYNGNRGAILISTNQVPYDWWTGYHEHRGTWKSWEDGRVRDYTQERVISFLDWASSRWKLDLSRVFTAGNSMGGSGAPNLGIRRADRVAWVVSWVGVHSPSRTPHFLGSYERVYGNLGWKLPYGDGGRSAFEHFDDAAFVRTDPARETPLICFSNGKNDSGIGWPQAQAFWKALQETRRPHVFVWGQGGHGQRARLPGPRPGERELRLDVRVDRTIPAFTRCTLDDDPGNGEPEDGDAAGQSNLHLFWEDEGIVDEASRWGMTLRVTRGAPSDACTADVTPRRCRAFRPAPGTRVRWTVREEGREVQSGEVAADRWGLVTAPAVRLRKEGGRLEFRAVR